MQVNYSIYLVTDRDILAGRDLLTAVSQAISGGVTLVQLREKGNSSRGFFELATALKKLANNRGVPLIINDRLDIALAVDADGLHIGQDDLPLITARRLLGKDKILGYTVHTVEQAVYGEQNGADYLGAGAAFPTGSKADTTTIGLSTLREIKGAVHIPVVGIGGIGAANAKSVKDCGVDGIAVISAILGKEDITGAAGELSQIWNA